MLVFLNRFNYLLKITIEQQNDLLINYDGPGRDFIISLEEPPLQISKVDRVYR